MSWLFKGIPVPTLAAVFILIFAGIFAIIGLATPNWHEVEQSTSVSSVPKVIEHHGIWARCSLTPLDSFDCGAHSEEKGFIKAVRAMEILAIMLGAVCIIITGVWAFLKIENNRQILAITYLITGFLAGLFGLIGIIIYAAEVNTAASNTTPGVSLDYILGWSFALATIAAVLTCIATALLALGWRMAQ